MKTMILCAVAALSLGCWSEPETLHQAMEKIDRAIAERDAAALMPYLSEGEVKVSELTETKLHKFLSGPYSERMKGFKPKGERRIMVDQPDWLAFERMFEHPDGRIVGFVVQIRPT